MLNRIADGREIDADVMNRYRIKRMGKDKNDIFWQLGKVHGLENIAFVKDEDLKLAQGNPLMLQHLCDKANDASKPSGPVSFDKAVENMREGMDAYRNMVDNMYPGKVYEPSDRKKLLALPFLLHKRSENPEPKYGQKEYDLFKKIYGKDWNHYQNVMFDPEEKITEFNYEKFINKHLLKNVDTSSQDFKDTIKQLNMESRTEMEQHEDNRDSFRKLMPILRTLDEEETDIFFHLINNKGRCENPATQRSNDLIDAACSNEAKEKLAKLSEEANFALKNTYLH